MASLTLIVAALAAAGLQPQLLDFHSEHCGPCRQMAPVVAELERRGHHVEKIDVDRQPEMASRFRVESIPCLVVVVDGREVDRVLGVTPLDQLESMLRKAGTANMASSLDVPNPAPLPAISEQPARGRGRGMLSGLAGGRNRQPQASSHGRQPLGNNAAPRLSPGEQVRPQSEPNEPLEALTAAAPARDQLQLAGIQSELPLATDAAASEFAASPTSANVEDWRGSPMSVEAPNAEGAAQPSAQNHLLAASVRLRIEDGNGHSYGSGTIIDTRDDDALVLTCGHVFRESQGKGAVTVDMFAPGSPKGLVGEVIGYDLESDVGLVSFRPGVAVTVARIAPFGVLAKPGDPVFNTGCNNGDDPTLRISRVTSIDKYLGPPNLQVAGQPVQGRSGGGLFNEQGAVIGVCNAADPTDNEGLYAGLPSIYKLLDTSGLSDVYRADSNMIAAAGQPTQDLSPQGARPPHMPAQMPLATNPVGATETSAAEVARTAPSTMNVMPVSGGSPAPVLAAGHQPGADVEVVCIIRSPSDPRRSEVVVFDRASPEFLQLLAHEQQRGGEPGRVAQPMAAPSRPAGVEDAPPFDPQLATMR